MAIKYVVNLRNLNEVERKKFLRFYKNAKRSKIITPKIVKIWNKYINCSEQYIFLEKTKIPA